MSDIPAPPRLVLDTNVWLDGLVFGDARVAPLFDALRRGRLVAVTDAVCSDEWQRVLRYPGLKLVSTRCIELERAYEVLATRLEPPHTQVATPLPRCKDADDQKFLELARACGATAVLSRDAELLRLSRRCERMFGFAVRTPEVWITTVDLRD